MIGLRHSRGGFRRRVPLQAALATLRLENSTLSSVTEPVTIGIPLAPGEFDPATQRLTGGWTYGAHNDRLLIASKTVTVEAESNEVETIYAVGGAQPAAPVKTISELLALADALATGGQTGWDVGITFVDKLTGVDVTYTASARHGLEHANTTWSLAETATKRLGLRRDTPGVKEFHVQTPLLDGVTISQHLLATWAIAFHSDDNFATLSGIVAELILSNSYLSATPQRFAGDLTITRGLGSPETVLDLQSRAIEASPITGSGFITITSPTSTYTADDRGKLYEDLDAASDNLNGIVITGSGNTMLLWPKNGAETGSTAGGLLMGFQLEHGHASTREIAWPADRKIFANRKIQEFRRAQMLPNQPALVGAATLITDLLASWASAGNHPHTFRAESDGGGRKTLFKPFNDQDESEWFGSRYLNINVDGAGFCDRDMLQMVIDEGRHQIHVIMQRFYLDSTTGHPPSPTNFSNSFDSLNEITSSPARSALIWADKTTHPAVNFFIPYLMTGSFTFLWAMSMKAFDGWLNGAAHTGTVGTGFNRYYLARSGSSTSGRHRAFTMLPTFQYARSLPTTMPAGLLPDSREDWINFHELNFQEYVLDFGVDGSTPRVAGNTAMDAYYPTTQGGTFLEGRFPAYMTRSLLVAHEWGLLGEYGQIFVKHAVGAIVGRFRAPQLVSYVPDDTTRYNVMYEGYYLDVALDETNKPNPWPPIYDVFDADVGDQTAWSERNMFLMIHAEDIGLMGHIAADTDLAIEACKTRAAAAGSIVLSGSQIDYTQSVNFSSSSKWFCIQPRS
jgi:hypothetical protein